MRFERALGMEAQFWLSVQSTVDLYDAQHSEAAVEIKKIKRLKKAA